jgi:hypothetical protein
MNHTTMKSMAVAGAAAAALLLGGCAATVQTQTPTGLPAPSFKVPAESAQRLVLNLQLDPRHAKDAGWDAFRKEWVDIVQEQATARGLKFAAQDGEPKATGEAGVLLSVKVNDYKHVSVGQRVMFGIMTGNAFIDAKAEFRDLRTGAVYGDRSYNTTSSAGQGVFAPVTPKQIYAIADDAIDAIKGR